MALANLLKEAVQSAVGATVAAEIQEIIAEIVAGEIRRALREHEDELAKLVRTAVASAIADMLKPEP